MLIQLASEARTACILRDGGILDLEMHRCRRCEEDVEGVYENPKIRRWSRAYFLIPIPFIPLFPIIASDFIVMIPLTMLYLAGAGAALRFATEKPLCPECGALVEPKP